jgi:hypothetical protein
MDRFQEECNNLKIMKNTNTSKQNFHSLSVVTTQQIIKKVIISISNGRTKNILMSDLLREIFKKTIKY